MKNYEEVLARITTIPNAASGGVRDITWLSGAEVIGLARDQTGRLELFLSGSRLKPRSATVGESLQFHSWHREFGQPLSANRLLLPALGHFNQVGAFICTELLRNGADRDIEEAFNVTEPIIELAIERLQLSQAALLGLAGELLLLHAVCQQAEDQLVAAVVQSWDGWRRSERDFHWERTGVEIKTTTRATSSHLVQGVHQVEPRYGRDGELPEDRLLLVSVGLQQADAGAASFSIPILVQRIIDRLSCTGNAGQVEGFLAHVAMYGSESGFGYNHTTMSKDAPFTGLFMTTFFRAYDMGDTAIEVLRRDDLVNHLHVDTDSVRFSIDLPAAISEQNPVAGANQVARSLLGI